MLAVYEKSTIKNLYYNTNTYKDKYKLEKSKKAERQLARKTVQVSLIALKKFYSCIII